MDSQPQRIEAHQNVSQIRPRVGAGAEEIVGINPLRIIWTPQLPRFGPAAPNIASIIIMGDRNQQQHQRKDAAPRAGVNPFRNVEPLARAGLGNKIF